MTVFQNLPTNIFEILKYLDLSKTGIPNLNQIYEGNHKILELKNLLCGPYYLEIDDLYVKIENMLTEMESFYFGEDNLNILKALKEKRDILKKEKRFELKEILELNDEIANQTRK